MKINKIILFKLYPFLYLIFLISFSSKGFSQNSPTQKKQLTASSKVSKVGYIDHHALRMGYKAFNDAKHKIANEQIAAKKSFDQSTQIVEQQANQLLEQDSLLGGKNRQQILNDASYKSSKLALDFQEGQKKRNQDRMAIMEEYEKKIRLAIDNVVSEVGFTDVKALDKTTVIQNGINITDLVLKKLN